MNYLEIALILIVAITLLIYVNRLRKLTEAVEELKRRVNNNQSIRRNDQSELNLYKRELESSLKNIRKKIKYCLNKFNNSTSEKSVYLVWKDDDREYIVRTVMGVHETYESAAIHLRECAMHENCVVNVNGENVSAKSEHTYLWINQSQLLSLDNNGDNL